MGAAKRGSHAARLRGGELDEGADDLVEAREQRRGWGDGPAALRELEAGQRLARRPERAVVPHLPIGSAAVHALGNVEGDAAAGAPQLSSQIAVSKLNAA